MNIIKNILALLVVSTSFYLTNAREKQVFPPEFYAKQKHIDYTSSSIVAVHPDDIYWTDISSQSGGLIDTPYLTKVCDGALYVMGTEASSGYGTIGRYTKKDGWRIVCDLDVDGSIWDFSVDGDNIYMGGGFTSAGPNHVPVRNIVRYNISTKIWYPMGEGLWDPAHTDVSNMVEIIVAYKGRVFIRGRYSHTGDKELSTRNIQWDGTKYVEDDIFPYYLTAFLRNDILYEIDAGRVLDTTKNTGLDINTWNGTVLTKNHKDYTWNLNEKGVIGATGFGFDSNGNYFFDSEYQYRSSIDSSLVWGTFILGFVKGEWKLLGGEKWQFTKVNSTEIVNEVSDDGQVFVAGRFSEGIGGDVNTFKNQRIVVWNGSDWTTMGTGIRNGGYVSSLTYYDGDVYVGGNFSKAGDKTTNGFAKWSKKMTSSVDEQLLASIPEVRLSPNPASDHITVELDNESNDCTITLFDLYGSNVGTYRLDGRRSTINTDHLSSGVYTLRVQYGGRIASTSMTIIR